MMKRNKTFALILAVVLLLTVSVGGTLAYLSVKTEAVNNQFNPAQVDCVVNEDFSVTNTGNVDAYIRAAVVVNWMDASGNVYGTAPTASDYSLEINSADWKEHGGFYYFKSRVGAKGTATATTTNLVASIDIAGTVPQGYMLSVEVVAEAIQADGTNGTNTAVVDAWGVQP